MTILDWIIWTTGVSTLLFISVICMICLLDWLYRAWNRLTFWYYGKERITELYKFYGWCRENKVKEVQKYADKNVINRWFVVMITLYLLRKYEHS